MAYSSRIALHMEFAIFRVVKSSISILLSLSILFSSLGLTVASHYCYGEAVETRFLYDLNEFGCGMAQLEKDSENPVEGTANLSERSCCESSFVVAEIDSDYKPQSIDLNLNIDFLTSLVLTSLTHVNSSVIETITPSYHSPPLMEQDRRVLFQSFLI